MPEFSLLSLNLRFGRADDGPDNWSFREKVYPSLLTDHHADFMFFQEVNDFQADYLIKLLAGYGVIGQRKRAPEFWQSNMIFFRPSWRCLQYEHFYLSHTPEIPSRFLESRWPRQCTLGLFQYGSCRLICVNTHFDFKPSVQVKSAALILEKLSRHSPDDPAILAGDFNADPESSCYKVFTNIETEYGTYQPVPFRNAFSPPFSGTHHRFSGDSDGGHIDWILYKGKIAPKSAVLIKDSFNGRFPSDHFPLKAVFEFKD